MTDHMTPRLVELRQYRLHPGQRGRLLELFRDEFVDGQERVGAAVLGYFCDLDDPDRVVWLRGYADHAVRPVALGKFYGGEVWARRRQEVNAMLADSDDVLQLRPLGGLAPISQSMVVATVALLESPAPDDRAAAVAAQIAAGVNQAGGVMVGTLVSDPSPNNFPVLPMREGEHALVALAGFTSRQAGDDWASSRSLGEAVSELPLRKHPQQLRLAAA